MNSIVVKDLTVKYNISGDKVDSLKNYVLRLLQGKLFFEEFTAVDSISFEIKSGSVVGLIGFNGAGKSTVLKALAGVLTPAAGEVQVKGSIAPLIELGAGFDIDLTARENIYLNGAVLGYSENYLKSKFDEIVEFAELRDFIDVPVKNFSSGMYARLGFSIATVVNPDILLVDEILSVGDIRFQQKCEAKIQSMIQSGTTVIIVSHSLEQIEGICSEAIWLDHGKIQMQGDAHTVCECFKNA